MACRRVVVAGATGFVGRALVDALAQEHEVVALTRSRSLPQGDPPGAPGVQWRTADLFSLLDVERALEGADSAYYLVHSMLPSAELTQGSFEDFDLILADNFARGAKKQGLSQLIYLGGIIPGGDGADPRSLSRHLRSRLEVEETFRANGVPFTALRASLVIGPNGSSFRIVERLVRRLPVMIAPRWTLTPTQPIAVDDLVRLLVACLGDPRTFDRVAEVAGPDVVSYRELMLRTAAALGLRRRILSVQGFAPGLSTLWVRLITGVPSKLIAPLVQSLRHPMVASDLWLQRALQLPGKSIDQALREALSGQTPHALTAPPSPALGSETRSPPTSALAAPTSRALAESAPPDSRLALTSEHALAPAASAAAPSATVAAPSSHEVRAAAPPPPPRRLSPGPKARFHRDVRSVQRLPLPKGFTAQTVAHEYARFLPKLMRPVMRVSVLPDGSYEFYAGPLRRPMLALTYSASRSTPDRQLFYITDGLLVDTRRAPGRFEFREALGGRCVLAGIHGFAPKLPWVLYKFSQALVHLYVMRAFGQHLARLNDNLDWSSGRPAARPTEG